MPEEITAEYETTALIEPTELKYVPWVTVACKTDLGRVRDNNEDKYEYFMSEDPQVLATKGLVFIVCDGMGGHAAGQIASELSCKTFIDVYLHHPSNEPEVAINAGVSAAHRFVTDIGRAVPSRKGMGTTLSSLMLIQNKFYIGQVGDSRIYRLREGEIRQLTDDHTWVDEMIRMGKLTPEEAENHPYKHVITRAIGGEGGLVPDVFTGDLMEGDVYLLCSDGMTNHVSDESIKNHLTQFSPSDAVWRLVGEALQNGGSDNCTVMVVRVDQIEEK